MEHFSYTNLYDRYMEEQRLKDKAQNAQVQLSRNVARLETRLVSLFTSGLLNKQHN